MDWELPHYTHLEPGPAAGGMRWYKRRPDLDDFNYDTGYIFPKFKREETLPAPVVVTGPHFTTTPPERAEVAGDYRYLPRVHDSHTDGFTWSLKKNPPGMTVDRHSGKIIWIPPKKGYYPVELCARSYFGKEVRQTWIIRAGKPAHIPTPIPNQRFREALRRKHTRSHPPLPLVWRQARQRSAQDRRATSPPGERRRATVTLRI